MKISPVAMHLSGHSWSYKVIMPCLMIFNSRQCHKMFVSIFFKTAQHMQYKINVLHVPLKQNHAQEIFSMSLSKHTLHKCGVFNTSSTAISIRNISFSAILFQQYNPPYMEIHFLLALQCITKSCHGHPEIQPVILRACWLACTCQSGSITQLCRSSPLPWFTSFDERNAMRWDSIFSMEW